MIERLQERIQKVLDSGEAQIGMGIWNLIQMNESPRDTILKYIEREDVKESELHRVLKNLCPHNGKRVKSKDGDTGVCSECGSGLDGWWCDKSPDHHCHYWTVPKDGKRVVEDMRDGSTVIMGDDTSEKRYETDDNCLFCHKPDERK